MSAEENSDFESPILNTVFGFPEIRPLIDIFRKGLPRRLSEMQAAAALPDLPQLNCLAHRLKGTASAYGFPELSRWALQVEELALGEGGTENLPELVAKICEMSEWVNPPLVGQ